MNSQLVKSVIKRNIFWVTVAAGCSATVASVAFQSLQAAIAGSILIGAGITGYVFHRRYESRLGDVERALNIINKGEPPEGLFDVVSSMLGEMDAAAERIKAAERQMEIERQEAKEIAFELQRLTENIRLASTSESVRPFVDTLFSQAVDVYAAAGVELWVLSDWQKVLPGALECESMETPGGRHVKLAAVAGWDASHSSDHYARGAPVIGVIDSCYRLTTNEPQSLTWLFESKWINSRGIRSFAAFPLIVRGESVGVLAVFSQALLSEIFLGVLECCAQTLALTLAETKSLDSLQSTLERLEAANLRQQEANVRLAEADRIKSEFLCNVSHELRTPLNGIIGFLTLLKDGLAESPEEQHEFISGAHRSSEHLLGLINNVLDLSEVESGQAEFTLSAVNPSEVIESRIEQYRQKAALKGLTLHASLDNELRIFCDRSKLLQILDNLVDNAIKFTTEGGVNLAVRRSGGLCHIDVHDTGIGIEPDRQPSVFDKFVQVDSSTTRHFGGTGLGLALSRGLAETMGAGITVNSKGALQGTTVQLTFGVYNEESLAAEAGEGRSGRDIILLSSDPAASVFAESAIRAVGYIPLVCHQLKDAKDLLKQGCCGVCLDFSEGAIDMLMDRPFWSLIASQRKKLPVVVIADNPAPIESELADIEPELAFWTFRRPISPDRLMEPFAQKSPQRRPKAA